MAENFIGMDKIQLGNIRQRCTEALPNMVAPQRDFVVPALFFGPEIRDDRKKVFAVRVMDLRSKTGKTKNKKRSLPYNYWFFGAIEVVDQIK